MEKTTKKKTYSKKYQNELNGVNDKEFNDTLATFNKITINGLDVNNNSLKVAIDQLILLSKSELWSLIVNDLYFIMEKYYELPVEKQVRTIPNKVNYIVNLTNELRELQDNYHKYRVQSKSAIEMNNPNEPVKETKRKYGITKEFLNNITTKLEQQESEIEQSNESVKPTIEKSKYNSIAEIMKSNLDHKEKAKEIELYLEYKNFTEQENNTKPKTVKPKTIKPKTVKPKEQEKAKEQEKPKETINELFKITNTEKLFNRLKKLYPNVKGINMLKWYTTVKDNYHNAKRIWYKIHYIYLNEQDFKAKVKEMKNQSLVKWKSSKIYIPKEKGFLYLIRTQITDKNEIQSIAKGKN